MAEIRGVTCQVDTSEGSWLSHVLKMYYVRSLTYRSKAARREPGSWASHCSNKAWLAAGFVPVIAEHSTPWHAQTAVKDVLVSCSSTRDNGTPKILPIFDQLTSDS